MAVELATAYLSLVPSMRGLQSQITEQLRPISAAAGAEGERAGTALGAGMASTSEEAAAKSGEASGSRWSSGFLGMAKQVAAGAFLYTGISKAADFAGQAVFGFNSTLQSSTLAFTTLLGSGQKAQAFLAQLQNFAKSTPFDFQGLVQNSQLLLGMGVNAKDLIPDLTALGDSVASVGGNADVLNNTILAFGQSMAKGTLDMGNMNQLLQGGIPTALKVLAAQYHVTTGEMVKMISSGKVQSSQALPLLVKGLEQGTSATAALGGMMDKQSQTFSGALSNIHDALTQALAQAFRPFFNEVNKGLVGLADWLGKADFSRYATDVIGVFSKVGSAVLSLAPIGEEVFNRVLVPAFKTVVDVAPNIYRSFMNLVDVVKPLVVAVAGGLVVAFDKLLPAIRSAGGVLQTATGFLKDHAGIVRTVVVIVGTAVAAWKAWSLAVTAWSAITKGAAIVQAAFNVVLDANPIGLVVIAIAALAAGVVYAWTHFQSFRNVVTDVWGYLKGFGLAVAGIFAPLLDTPSAISTAWSAVSGFFGRVWSPVVAFLKTWGPIALSVLAPFVGIPLLIWQHWSTIYGYLGRAWSAVVGFLRTWGPVALAVLVPFVGVPLLIWQHWSTIEGYLGRAWSAVYGFLRTWGPVALAVLVPFIGIPLLIWQHFSAIEGYMSRAWSSAYATVAAWINRIVGAVEGLPGRIAGVAGDLLNVGKSLVNDFWNGLHVIGSGATDLASALVNAIKRGLDDMLSLPLKVPRIRIGAFGHYVSIGGETLIPRLAAGGLTQGLTLAALGDNPSGAEAVLPLDSRKTTDALTRALTPALAAATALGRSSAPVAARTPAGPAVAIANATFVEPVNIDTLMQKAAWHTRSRRP